MNALRALCVVAALAAFPARAFAFPAFVTEVPCRATAVNTAGTTRPCITCHDNADGGAACEVSGGARPCLNAFGMAFRTNNLLWNRALATADADNDGYTNGEELGDPMGTWMAGAADPATCACATRPGFPTFTPGDRDADGDAFCCRGRDLTNDGDCLDDGEHDSALDCDDASATSNPNAPELCTNVADDNCDGLPTLRDPLCAGVVDRDGDGFCATGRDQNRDADCIDSGEITADVDCNDAEITVFPGAFENCVDGLDNDCNTQVDRDDPICRPDADNDADGYCPIGSDLNRDGDCLDAGEEDAGSDCNDRDANANPARAEACTDGVDNDCDGRTDFRDDACRVYFDGDGDGYCPAGRDGNADLDCVDDGETAEPGDCDDANAAVHPAHAEVCTNGRDDDCDGFVSLRDPQCATYLDTDADRYCFAGFDVNRDGDCADDGESPANGDCDEASANVNPGVEESCTNGVDDDCDGSTDAFDAPTCDIYRDRDGDGWCAFGRDGNADGDCTDANEAQEPNDAGHDEEPTVHPGAPEHCFDRLDNDLDGEVDEAGACTRDRDADGDGYCPIGRDVNGDADCLDAGENFAESDCDDDDPSIHPGAVETCRANVDRDCDTDVGLLDVDCYGLLDRDRDGFCGTGVDDNANGSCLDEGEDRFGEDCDDRAANVHPRAREACDNGVDDDCDGAIDAVDRSCPCSDAASCDDGQECTQDRCESGTCVWTPICGDAGPIVVPEAGCDCRAAPGASRSPVLAILGLAILGFALVARRRKTER